MVAQRSPIIFSLAYLALSWLPSQRADGALASASTQAEFDWAVAQYVQCVQFPNAQCWNLVLDPFGVTDVDVRVQFEEDSVLVGPEFIAITPGNFYDFGPNNDPVVVRLGNNMIEIQNLSFTVFDQTPFEQVNVFSIEIVANPDFIRPFATFAALASNVFVEDHDIPGIRSRVPDELVVQPGEARIVPELIPCDFDGDQRCDVADIDILNMAIAGNQQDPQFDLNNDRTLNLTDLAIWRRLAATRNGLSRPYPLGDANLDGMVTSVDLNQLGLHWRQKSDRWSAGDFNASGFVDAADLNDLALNWRQQVPPAAAVPEPSGIFLFLAGIGVLAFYRRPEQAARQPYAGYRISYTINMSTQHQNRN